MKGKECEVNMRIDDQRGFTLIELLAVVVILLAISVIAVSSISASIERNKAKQNEAKIEVIVSYGKLYYEEHRNTLYRENGNKDSGCISISKLDLSENEAVDANGEYFTGGVKYTNGNNFEYVESCY